MKFIPSSLSKSSASEKHKATVALLLVFALALFLRLYRLGTLPANFHEDEVLSGFIGRYILQNGKDIYGNPWPLLYFNKFGDFYIILPVYLSGLATYVFGINEFAVRFPIALFGALAVFPVYLLVYWTTKNKSISLLSALLSAIVPWQLVLGRSTTEGIIGCTLFLTGIVLFLQSIKKQNIPLLVLSSILFFITYDIYHPFRLYTPLIFISTFLIFRNQMKKKKYILSYLFAMIFFFALTLYIGTTFWGKGRFVQTSIFSPISGVSIKINELMFGEGQQQIHIARLFHNKIIMYGREFINQYFSYFSPSLLFVNGWQKSRYYVPEQGLMFLSFLVFLFLAILPIKTKPSFQINKQHFLFLLFLLFLAPFPAAFTVIESPNVHRA
ncbi:glycosyltransferase family 39 protein [Candidatus Roizmanbacteria bacterium]|nr:glycosyltransferase family 39 protein [Candidatus Roizmanbacteria bacterium]